MNDLQHKGSCFATCSSNYLTWELQVCFDKMFQYGTLEQCVNNSAEFPSKEPLHSCQLCRIENESSAVVITNICIGFSNSCSAWSFLLLWVSNHFDICGILPNRRKIFWNSSMFAMLFMYCDTQTSLNITSLATKHLFASFQAYQKFKFMGYLEVMVCTKRTYEV